MVWKAQEEFLAREQTRGFEGYVLSELSGKPIPLSAVHGECAALRSYNGFNAATVTERNDTMNETSFARKRVNPRFDFFADAEITLSDGTLVLGRLSELSARGCCLTMLRLIPIEMELSLRLSDDVSSCGYPCPGAWTQ
jgi:hypothetical protein